MARVKRYVVGLTIAFVGLISWLVSPAEAPQAPTPAEDDVSLLEGIR